MNKIEISTTICNKEDSLSFKEKLEIVRQLDKLNVSSIWLPELSDKKEDALLLRTCFSFVKNSTISVATADIQTIARIATATNGAKNSAIRVELNLSTVGMEYIHHKKPAKMLECIAEIVAEAKAKTANVEFVALDATRAENAFLKDALITAEKAGASIIYLVDSAAEMLPNEFADFVADCQKSVKVPVGVACQNKNGFAVASALLAVSSGAKAVNSSINGNGVDLETFATAIKNCGTRNAIGSDIGYTELNRIVKQIKRITDNGAEDKSLHIVKSDFQSDIKLDKTADKKEVLKAVAKIGYDLSDDDQAKVYEEFLRMVDKTNVGEKELDAIVASVALQVPETYKLDTFIVNSGNKMDASAQITLIKGDQVLKGISIGNGPIDAAFLALEQIVGHHYELDDFQIQSVNEGKDALGSAIVKLRNEGKLYSGNGISTDIIGASIRAYISAINKIAYEET